MAMYAKGKQVSGTTNNAFSVNCLDKDGNKSTVQAEMDNLNMRYNPQTDKIEIFYNGKWQEWKIAGLQRAYLFVNGQIIETYGTLKHNMSLQANLLRTSTDGYGIWINTFIGISAFSKLCVEYTLPVDTSYQVGICTSSASLPSIIHSGTGRGNFTTINMPAGENKIYEYNLSNLTTSNPGIFIGIADTSNAGLWQISKVWLE